jgi:hypothetical protein
MSDQLERRPETRATSLMAAVAEEQAQLVALRGALAAQREGVASGDAAVLETASHRVAHALMTLDEARRRREALVANLGFRATTGLDAVDAHFGGVPGLAAAREELRTAAAAVLHDLEVTQEVLQGALRAGDSYIQALFASVTDAYPAAGSARGDVSAPAPGRLLNREA